MKYPAASCGVLHHAAVAKVMQAQGELPLAAREGALGHDFGSLVAGRVRDGGVKYLAPFLFKIVLTNISYYHTIIVQKFEQLFGQ